MAQLDSTHRLTTIGENPAPRVMSQSLKYKIHPQLEPGTLVDNWRIESVLSHTYYRDNVNPKTVTYLATNAHHPEQKVVLKMRRPRHDMFLSIREEYKALKRINHPNVVKAHALGSHKGYPYLVSEYVDGVTLRHYCLYHGPLEETHLVRLLLDIANILQDLARRRIDLRSWNCEPPNIMYCPPPYANQGREVEHLFDRL